VRWLAPLAIVLPLLLVGEESARVTFLGNEGFLIEAEGRKVLVDGLVSRKMPAYVRQTDELRAKLEGAAIPYDVDLVLATHVHGDHFDAEAVARHLAANPEAVFVSTEQAVAELEEREDYESYRDRVRALAPDEGVPFAVDELGLVAFNLHHGRSRRPPIQNNGYLFEVGGVRFLHMGDSEASSAELAPLQLTAREIDVALVPSWYLDAEPWKGAVQGRVAAGTTVAMHLAPDWKSAQETPNQRESRARVARIRAAHPEAVLFERPLEARTFAPD